MPSVSSRLTTTHKMPAGGPMPFANTEALRRELADTLPEVDPVASPPPLGHQGFAGTPSQGSGIVGWGGGMWSLTLVGLG